MVRLVVFLVAVAAFATGLSWLADRPGSLVINWQGHEVETSVFHAIVILALSLGSLLLLWSLLVQAWRSPALIGALLNRRRQVRGLDALSSGMIAIGAGDRSMALRYASQARKSLPNEPLTHLLRAQAAQLGGDRTTARRIFEAMLAAPDTEQLGLRGLFLEAEREGEGTAARQFAERALRLNPRLGWPVDALFEMQCKERDWDGALETLAVARRNGLLDKSVGDRRRAVVLTARAQALEDNDPLRACQLALEAHHLAHDLIPAAAIAGRLLAARGNTRRAARVIERTWRRAPHPDLATAYAHARVGDSPRDRLDRVKRLETLNHNSPETPIAIANAAIEARDWEVARSVLAPLGEARQTQRVCTLMARVESEQSGDKGRVREWLARAVHAPRDPVWTADGIVSERWEPVSPVTGALDAFQWRVPVEAMEPHDAATLARKLDELTRLGDGGLAERDEAGLPAASREPAVDSPSSADRPAASGRPDTRRAVDAQIANATPNGAVKDAPKVAPSATASESTARPEAGAMARSPSKPSASEGRPAGGASNGHAAPGEKRAAEPAVAMPPRPPDDPGIEPAAPPDESPAGKRPV